MESCLLAIKNKGIKTLDITGGAPEMNPHFRWFLKEGHGSGAHVIVRTNLVILTEEGTEFAERALEAPERHALVHRGAGAARLLDGHVAEARAVLQRLPVDQVGDVDLLRIGEDLRRPGIP